MVADSRTENVYFVDILFHLFEAPAVRQEAESAAFCNYTETAFINDRTASMRALSPL